ncbi:hypothetical protein ROSEINA2194_03166 [Roseburia inulinivorans DSM 16841]|uniref:Uncharacterized protein n=1 Tax=Roseburia inulinivorans DSM 16841 TaxID=622312 RepID=C0FWN5_9FIRM|nr:hypothetical protein ROSEINA2194_03166 [Roseburia inulinivorans DSM 16841]
MTVDNSTENLDITVIFQIFSTAIHKWIVISPGTTNRTWILWINNGYEFSWDKHIHKKFLRNAQS